MLSDVEYIAKALKGMSTLTDVVIVTIPELAGDVTTITSVDDHDERLSYRAGISEVLLLVLSSGLPVELAGDAWRTLMLEMYRMHVEVDDAYLKSVMTLLCNIISSKVKRVVGDNGAKRTVLVKEIDLVSTYSMIIEIYTEDEGVLR